MKYEKLWRNKFLTKDAKNISDMIGALKSAVKTLEEMQTDGVVLLNKANTHDDYATLGTTDSSVATKYNFHDNDHKTE